MSVKPRGLTAGPQRRGGTAAAAARSSEEPEDFDASTERMASALDPAYRDTPLDASTASSTIRTLLTDLSLLSKEHRRSLEALNEAGAELAECGADGEVDRADAAVRDVLAMQAEVEIRKEVLEGLRERANDGEQLSDLGGWCTSQVREKKAAWEAQSMRKKFASNPAYKQFRERVWEGKGLDEPMPSIKTFLPAGDELEDNSSDEEIEIAGGSGRNDFKCPLCMKPIMRDPVRSSKCRHAFCKQCFVDLMHQNRASTISCPIAGCVAWLSMRDVAPDEALTHRLKAFARREALRREREAEEEEGEEEEAGNGDGDGDDVKVPVGTQRSTQGGTQKRRTRVVVDDDDDD